MGQEDVYRLLKEKEKEMTVQEISKILDLSIWSVGRALNLLKKRMEVENRRLTRKEIKERERSYTGNQIVWAISKYKEIDKESKDKKNINLEIKI